MAAINNCTIFWWCAHCCWLWWWWWSFWFGYQLIYRRRQSFCDATMRKWISVSANISNLVSGGFTRNWPIFFRQTKLLFVSIDTLWCLYALFHIHNSEGWTFKLNGLNVKTSRTNEIESYKRQHTDCNENNNNKKNSKLLLRIRIKLIRFSFYFLSFIGL